MRKVGPSGGSRVSSRNRVCAPHASRTASRSWSWPAQSPSLSTNAEPTIISLGALRAHGANDAGMPIDDRCRVQFEARPVGQGGEVGERAARELPVDEAILRVDGARRRAQGAVLAAAMVAHTVRLDQYPATFGKPAGENAEKPEWILDSVQDPEAEDEVEALPHVVESVGIRASVLDPGAQQSVDRVEALATFEFHLPAVPHPVNVLLVVDRKYSLRSPCLGEEAVETVERSDIEHAKTGEGIGDRSEPVAMVAGGPRCVQAEAAVQSERMEPKRHRVEHPAAPVRIDLDRHLSRNLALRRPAAIRSQLLSQLASPLRVHHQSPEPRE